MAAKFLRALDHKLSYSCRAKGQWTFQNVLYILHQIDAFRVHTVEKLIILYFGQRVKGKVTMFLGIDIGNETEATS